MKLKRVCTVYSTIAAIICVNFLVVPAFWIRLYGATADPQALLLFRLIGASFAGLALIAWTGRTAQTPASGRGLRRSMIASNGLAAVVAVFGALNGVYNQFAWGPVGMFSMLTLAFLFARPASPRDPALHGIGSGAVGDGAFGIGGQAAAQPRFETGAVMGRQSGQA